MDTTNALERLALPPAAILKAQPSSAVPMAACS